MQEAKEIKEIKTENVKGFQDFSGQEALKREAIKKILVEKFKTYGFCPAETPLIEFEEFVKGQNVNDEAISDIFRLKDRGERELALRYEFTFQLKRLVVGKKLPFRRYQIGEVFRDEPVSSNRFRQFTQCDVDIIGSNLREDAEVLKVFSEILKELKIPCIITINNRKLLNEILESEGIKDKFGKEQVIREIDKLDKLEENEVKANLVKYNAEKIVSILKKQEKYFEKYESFKEIQELKKFCLMFGFKVEFSPFLARGLSYYNGSVFEIRTKEIKESIAGGGSYLVNGIQSTGISFGLERLASLADIDSEGIKCILISLGQDKESIKLVQELRENKVSCFVMDKLSKALDYANQEKIPFVVFIGKEEIEKKKFKLRDMKSGKEEFLTEKEIIKRLTWK
jgi:histidyl-tRNA synthetase